MGWTTARTWIAGELVTAAIGNTHWRDNLAYLYDNQGIFPFQVRRTGKIGPFTISGSTDNYNPAGIATAARILLDPSGGSQTLTGIAAQDDGDELLLINIDTGANDIVLSHANASSTSSNRFALAGAANINIRPNGMALISYESSQAKWNAQLV